MSAAYSSRLRCDELGPLGLVGDRLDLVVEDGVDRRLGTHHGDRGARQGDAAVGLEGRPGHRVEAGAVGLADHHRELRHGRFGDGADHLRAVADDPLALDRGADHEAGHVGEEQQRQVEGVAGLDEARRLVGRVDEQHAAFLARLVGDDPDRLAVEPRVADDQLLRPALVDFEQAAGVEQRVEHLAHVEWLVLVGGDDLGYRRVGGGRGRLGSGRALAPVAGHEGEVAPRQLDRLLVALDEEVAAAGDAGVHLRPAHLLQRHLLADHHLRHPRRAQVHRGVALAHDHDVAEGRDVGAAGGARPEQQADLRHLAREPHLVVEDPPGAAAPRETSAPGR